MAIVLRFVVGMIIAGLGFLLVWKTRDAMGFFGTIDWAEQKIGPGGTNLLMKLIGVAIIFIGFMWATNLWNAFLEATLGSLFPKPQL